MIGILMNPMMAIQAAMRSRAQDSVMAARTAIKARYKKNKINTEVNRASQIHQVPHMGFPQMEPVTRARKVNQAPIRALQDMQIAAIFTRQTSVINAAIAIVR